MAAYLVAAGSAPAAKKGAAETAQKQKSKKQDSAQQAEHAALDRHPTRRTSARCAASSVGSRTSRIPPSAGRRSASGGRAGAARPRPRRLPRRQRRAKLRHPSAPAQDAGPPPVVFDIPLPEMPQAPPADLTQSAFTSSPLP